MNETCVAIAPAKVSAPAPEAPKPPRRYPTMSSGERALWARHLELKDALASAGLKGDLRGVRTLEEELKLLEDRIYAPWRRRKKEARPVAERFSYKIPVVEAETGRVKGHLVADPNGIHRPEALQEPLPPNDTQRSWLKVLEPSKAARQEASRTWHATGHKGRPRCPGCRCRKDLIYLEFRNGDEADRWRSSPVLAVCDAAAVNLVERSRREVFGITTLGGRVPWGCAQPPAGTGSPLENPTEEPRKESRRGKHRNPRSLANLIPHARGGPAGRPHSFRVESA